MTPQQFKEKYPEYSHLEGDSLWNMMENTLLIEKRLKLMKNKIYKVLKRYPSLGEYFQIGDYLYYSPIEGEHTEGFYPSKAFVYRKAMHLQKDPFIWAEEVENNPEFFEYVPNGIKIVEN